DGTGLGNHVRIFDRMLRPVIDRAQCQPSAASHRYALAQFAAAARHRRRLNDRAVHIEFDAIHRNDGIEPAAYLHRTTARRKMNFGSGDLTVDLKREERTVADKGLSAADTLYPAVPA